VPERSSGPTGLAAAFAG